MYGLRWKRAKLREQYKQYILNNFFKSWGRERNPVAPTERLRFPERFDGRGLEMGTCDGSSSVARNYNIYFICHSFSTEESFISMFKK